MATGGGGPQTLCLQDGGQSLGGGVLQKGISPFCGDGDDLFCAEQAFIGLSEKLQNQVFGRGDLLQFSGGEQVGDDCSSLGPRQAALAVSSRRRVARS